MSTHVRAPHIPGVLLAAIWVAGLALIALIYAAVRIPSNYTFSSTLWLAGMYLVIGAIISAAFGCALWSFFGRTRDVRVHLGPHARLPVDYWAMVVGWAVSFLTMWAVTHAF